MDYFISDWELGHCLRIQSVFEVTVTSSDAQTKAKHLTFKSVFWLILVLGLSFQRNIEYFCVKY